MLNTFNTPVNSLLLHNKDNQFKAQLKKGTRRRKSNCPPLNQQTYVLAYSTAANKGGQGL